MKRNYACMYGKEKEIVLKSDEISLSSGQVLLKVIACGICHGDVLLYNRTHPEGRPFGHEPVGEVVEAYQNEGHLKKGDWVVGCVGGGFSDYCIADESNLYKVSRELGAYASLAEPLKCVTTVCRAASPDFGDTVIVLGCGFMGLSAIKVLSSSWKKKLIALDPVAERRKTAMEFGADLCLDPLDKNIHQQIADETNGNMADVAVEFSGHLKAPDLAAELLKKRGKLVLGGGHPTSPDASRVYLNALTILHVPPAFSPDEPDDWRRTIAAMEGGLYPLEELTTHQFKLTEIDLALKTANRGTQENYLKGIVTCEI